jgi:methyl-accepting chemotaxis protein
MFGRRQHHEGWSIQLREISSALLGIQSQLERIGDLLMDIATAFADLTKSIDGLTTSASAELKRVGDELAALKAQIAAGTPITADQIEAQAQRIAAVQASLDAFEPPKPPAPPTP